MNFNIPSEWKAPLVGALSFAAGTATGWVAHKKYRDRLVARLLEDSFDTYVDGSTEDEDVHVVFPSPSEIIGRTDKVDQKEDGTIEVSGTFTKPDIHDIKEAVLPKTHGNINVFERFAEAVKTDPEAAEGLAKKLLANAPVWDQISEEIQRTKDAPYVIHKDEWDANENGYSQQTLTWYAGDKILADESDVPVYNHEKVVGRLEFGRGSTDPDVVFVRNDKLRAEYEIVRHGGHYAIEVMGLEAEEQADDNDLRHSLEIRRFRLD